MMGLLASLRSAKEIFDGLFTLASLICVPTLTGMGIMWSLEPPSGVKVTGGPSYSVRATAGEEAKVPVPRAINNSQTLVYKMQLLDESNYVVQEYPEVVTSPESSPEFGNLMFRIPPSVPSGDYRLIADITYTQSPLKTGTLQIELAQISVTR